MNIQFVNFMKALSTLFEGAKILEEQGIVHMDIKNDNIVVGKARKDTGVGLIRLIDFGSGCLVKEINKSKNLYNNTALSAHWYPPEFCVSGCRRGLLNILTKNLNQTRRDLFFDAKKGKDVRLNYLEMLGYSTAPADLEASQWSVVNRMREGVQSNMNAFFSAQDEDGDYIYEEFFDEFALEASAETAAVTGDAWERDENGNIVFDLDKAEYILEAMKDPHLRVDDDDEEIAAFLKRMEHTLRKWMITECDAFSIADEVYDTLKWVLETAETQTNVNDRWHISDDVVAKAHQVMGICVRMMDPDISTRMRISDAYDALLTTHIFEAPVPPGYRTAEQAQHNSLLTSLLEFSAAARAAGAAVPAAAVPAAAVPAAAVPAAAGGEANGAANGAAAGGEANEEF
jgi:hypothetical protein